MKALYIGLVCGLALGCNQDRPPEPRGRLATDQSTTTSQSRPVETDARLATDRTTTTANEQTDRTNTGINVRDRDSTAKTSPDQNQNQSDINITAEIRKQVVASKMSSNAQNVKIITQSGKVTLRGPVQTTEEKQRIGEIALAVAGADRVDNQLEVNRD